MNRLINANLSFLSLHHHLRSVKMTSLSRGAARALASALRFHPAFMRFATHVASRSLHRHVATRSPARHRQSFARVTVHRHRHQKRNIKTSSPQPSKQPRSPLRTLLRSRRFPSRSTPRRRITREETLFAHAKKPRRFGEASSFNSVWFTLSRWVPLPPEVQWRRTCPSVRDR